MTKIVERCIKTDLLAWSGQKTWTLKIVLLNVRGNLHWETGEQILHKAFDFRNCRCFLDYLQARRRNKCEETLPPRQRCPQKLLNLDFSDSGMIFVFYKSFSKEIMHFSSMPFLVCWPSNASGEGKRRRNVQCSPQIWCWFTTMCCKHLQSQKMSSTMTSIFGHHFRTSRAHLSNTAKCSKQDLARLSMIIVSKPIHKTMPRQ